MKLASRLIIASLACAAATLSPAAAVAHPPTRAHASHGRGHRRTTSVARRGASVASFAGTYTVFARAPQSEDQAPAAVAQLAALANNPAKAHPEGVDVSGSRHVGAAAPIYLMPSSGGLCAVLVIPEGQASTMACTDTVHQGFIAAVTSTPGGWAVWGGAADSVADVAVTLPGGATQTVPVHNNGFFQEFPNRPTAVQPGGPMP